MNKKVKLALITGIALFLVAMWMYPDIKSYFENKEEKQLPESPVQVPKNTGSSNAKTLHVNATVLKSSTINDIYRTKGLLIPNEEVDLSFETSGKITEILFKEGSNVEKGQLLAKVNDKPLQAELNKLLAQIPLAKDRVYRQKTLLEKDAVSQESYESVRTDLEKLEADIELVKTRIAQTELRAPFHGVIGLKHISEGTYATPSTVISHLTSIIPLKIEFSVNEKQVSSIAPGTKIDFKLDNDLGNYKAEVYAIESKLDAQTLTLRARALYPNKGGLLKPGLSASLEIELFAIDNAISIPAIASIAEMGKDIVYVARNGKANRLEIKKGLRTASSVQVLEGLQIGDTLLVNGVMQLREGMPVVIDKFVEQ